MGLNDFLVGIAVKMNMLAVNNNDNLSLKEQIRQNLVDERILSINMEGELPVVRIILKGLRDDLLLKNEDKLIEKAKEIGKQINPISEKYKLYLIDEKYQIMIITNEQGDIAYKE